MILNESNWFPWSFRINLVPFLPFSHPLFHKPVTGQVLFLPLVKKTGSKLKIICLINSSVYFRIKHVLQSSFDNGNYLFLSKNSSMPLFFNHCYPRSPLWLWWWRCCTFQVSWNVAKFLWNQSRKKNLKIKIFLKKWAEWFWKWFSRIKTIYVQ